MFKEFREYLKGKGIPSEKVESTIVEIGDLESHLRLNGVNLDNISIEHLKDYISTLIEEGRSSESTLVSLARYFHFTRKNDLYIYIAGVVNAVDVLPTIRTRLDEIVGNELGTKVFEDIVMPPIGSPQESYPQLTRTVVQRMERELSVEKCRELLTWNYHQIPASAFLGHKERYEAAATLDEFLMEEHHRFVQELTSFMKEGKVWYEQEITPDVVSMAERDQELSWGVIDGERIYVTKIPFDPQRYLHEKDPRMRRFYACHCPLVRTAIRDGRPLVSKIFCHCSAGFTKLPYDVIFGESVQIEMLESVLAGDNRCRFAIKVPSGKMK